MLPLALDPADRVLLLSLPDHDRLDAIARAVTRGIVVGLGDDDAVRAARRALRDRDNVMFTLGTPDDIPWQDSFFTVVADAHATWPNPGRALLSIGRVLAPGGRAALTVPLPAPGLLAAAALHVQEPGPPLMLVSTKLAPRPNPLPVLR